MKKPKLYYYPNTPVIAHGDGNPYSNNMMDCLEKEFDIISRGHPTTVGVLDILKRIRKIDVLFCNWIEDVPNRKHGLFQAVLLILLIRLKHVFNFRLVWVLHNKISHEKKHYALKKYIVGLLARYSDVILTHASEGINFARQFRGVDEEKVHFLHHPVGEFSIPEERAEYKYDVLIWGSMAPYKGIREFLELVRCDPAFKYKVMIWGKFTTDRYYQECLSVKPPKVTIKNDFINFEDLGEILNCCRTVLFPYEPGSILSSGALMDSLNSRAVIVGPKAGVFNDLKDEGSLYVYASPGWMLSTIRNAIDASGQENLVMKREKFFAENEWPQAGRQICREIISALATQQGRGVGL